MKTAKFIGVIILLLSICMLIAACQTSGVASKQIENDLQEIDEIKNGTRSYMCIPNNEYIIKQYEITKRQTNLDNKNDIIYCTAVISNGYIESEIECKMVYNFYDKGGWILDDYDVVEKESKPVAGIEKAYIPQINVVAQNRRYELSSSNVQSITFVDGDIPYSLIVYTYNDGLISFEGNIECEFVDGDWQYPYGYEFFQLNNFSVNWSSNQIVRTFNTGDDWLTLSPRYQYYKSQADYENNRYIFAGRMNVRVSFDIASIENGIVKGTYSITGMDYSSYVGETYPTIKENISLPFETPLIDAVTGQFEIPFAAEVFSYHHAGYGFIDPCYTSVDAKLCATYNFDKNRWDCSLKIMNLNLSDSAIIEGSD